MLLFAGMYKSFVCGLQASGGQSLPPPMLGQNSAPRVAPGRLERSTWGRPVFESIAVNTLLLENGNACTNLRRSRSNTQRYPFRPACVAVLVGLPSISVSIRRGADTSSQSQLSCGVY